jgi:hypothetical protein
MPVALTIKPIGFAEAEKKLTEANKNFPKVSKDAILRGLKHGRTVADKEIRNRYAITKANVMPKLSVELDNEFKGRLESKGPMLPVSMFAPVQKKKGVAVTILKGRGRRRVIAGSFLKKGKVWQRVGKDRYPIKVVSTAGVPLMTSVKEVSEKVQKAIEVFTAQRLVDNVARSLAGKAFG